MTLTEVMQNVNFVVDMEGNKKAALLDLPVWEKLVAYMRELEEDATEELLAMPSLVDAINKSSQRVKSGQFTRYEDIKRNV